MHFMPLLDRVLILPNDSEEAVSPGGMILPESMQTAIRTGTVVATGPGRYYAGVGLVHCTCKPGDVAFYTQHSGAEIVLDGRRMRILNESEIVAMARDVPTEDEAASDKIIGTIKRKEMS